MKTALLFPRCTHNASLLNSKILHFGRILSLVDNVTVTDNSKEYIVLLYTFSDPEWMKLAKK